MLPRLAADTFLLDEVLGFFADCLVGAFLLTLPFAALRFLPAALVEAFFALLPAAFLLTDFFRAAMLSILAFAL